MNKILLNTSNRNFFFNSGKFHKMIKQAFFKKYFKYYLFIHRVFNI